MNERRVPKVALINTFLFKSIFTKFWAKAQSICEGQSDASRSDCLSRFGLITPDRGNIRGRGRSRQQWQHCGPKLDAGFIYFFIYQWIYF